MGEEARLSGLFRQLLLTLLNAEQDPEKLQAFLFERARAPSERAAAGRLRLASRIVQFRSQLPEARYSEISQLLEVQGIGPSTFQSILKHFEQLPPEAKALLFINTLQEPELFPALLADSGRAGPALSGFDRARLEELIRVRSQLPGAVFPTLESVTGVSGVSGEDLRELVSVFALPPAAGAYERSRLAAILRSLFSAALLTPLPAAEKTVAEVIGILSPTVSTALRSLTLDLYRSALDAGAIDRTTRLADLILLPEVAAVRVATPPGITDPSTLPDVSPDYRWLRSSGVVVITPAGGGRLQWLRPEGWTQPVALETRIAVEPVAAGIQVRRVFEGDVFPRDFGENIGDPARAVRISSGDGIHAILSESPRNVNPTVLTAPPLPAGWVAPGRESRVHAGPLSPGIFGPDPRRLAALPRSVILALEPSPTRVTRERATDETRDLLLGILPATGLLEHAARRVVLEDVVGFPVPGPPVPPDVPPPAEVPPPAGGGVLLPPFGEEDFGPGGGGGSIVIVVPDPEVGVGVSIAGCDCIRRSETSRYTARPVPEGGTFQWSVDDKSVAEIQGPADQQTVTLKSKKVGDVRLTVEYTKNGRKATANRNVAVIYQRFTPRATPGSEILALPLFQAPPQVRISAQGRPSYRVEEIDTERHRARFLFDIQGELRDPLVDISEVEVLAGTDFRISLPKDIPGPSGFFTNSRFEARGVPLYGPGRGYIRVLARNFEFVGSDTLDVVIRIKPEIDRIIAGRESTLASLRENDADPRYIREAEEALRNAWDAALRDVELEVAALKHSANRVQRIPGREKWAVAVEDDIPVTPALLETAQERQSVLLRRRSPRLLVPSDRPRDYFVLHGNYRGNRVNWPNDGRLLGYAGETVALTYIKDCCGHGVPVVGVVIDPKPGVKTVKKGEAVTLSARGFPEEILGNRGIYTWVVEAYPASADPLQDFRFEPSGPTTSRQVNFFTTVPGIYTFIVYYELLGARSPWTCAVADCQIMTEIDAVTRLKRTGRQYEGEFAADADRPYYRKRTVREQPGAELLVTTRDGGPLGQDLEVIVTCPAGLKFSEMLTARAFYDEGDYRDFSLHVDARFPHQGRATIRSPRVIKSLGILGIRYGNLPSHAGDAVWVDVQVRLLAVPVADLAASRPTGSPLRPSTPISPGGVTISPPPSAPGIVVGPGAGTGVPAEPPANPLVNLILRTPDLGNALASQGLVELSELGSPVNLTNGNQNFGLLLFQSESMGQACSPYVSYNSKEATLAEAKELYGRYNGKGREQVEREFGKTFFGKGWCSSFDLSLFEFVDTSGDFDNPVLTRCVEVRLFDGNRIVFSEVSPGVYHVADESEAIGDSPDTALSLVLRKLPDGTWRLEEEDGTWWVFDANGLIAEKSDPRVRIPGRQLQPMRWSWTATSLVITDSARRQIMARIQGGRIEEVKAPDQATYTFVYQEGRLQEIRLPLGVTWGFSYRDYSLMSRITPPLGHFLSFTHYLGDSVEGVPLQIAREFWGYVAAMDFGDRHFSIRYHERNDAEQLVTCVDAEGHFWRYRYPAARQAVERVEYAAKTAPEQWKLFARFEYRDGSKAIRRITDLHSAVKFFIYRPGRNLGKGELLLSESEPGGISRNYRHDGQNRVEEFTDEEREVTNFSSYEDRQIRRIDYPRVSVIGADLQSRQVRPFEEFTYDELGRLKTHLGTDGVLTTYGYGGPGDPHGTGRPTSITRGSHTTKLEWDILGRLRFQENHFGFRTGQEFDMLGRLVRETAGEYVVTHRYDALNRLYESEDSLGRKWTTVFSEYGEVNSVTNPEGRTREFLERDKKGLALKTKQEDGAIFQYRDYDPLGRWGKVIPPSVQRSGQDGLSTADAPELSVNYLDQPQRFEPLATETVRIEEIAGSVKTVRHYSLRGLLVAVELEREGRKTIYLIGYDRRDNPTRVAIKEGEFEATLCHRRWNVLGELIESSEGGVTTRFSYWRDGEGRYELELYPSQSLQEGKAPSKVVRFDDNDRPVAELDGFGKKMAEYIYDDAARQCVVRFANPTTDSGEPLVEALTITYDIRGEVEEVRNMRTGQVTHHQHDDLGRLERVVSPVGEIAYRYDDMERVRQMEIPVPAAAEVNAIAGPDAAIPPSAVRGLILSREYDPVGRLKSKGTDSAAEQYVYDALGRPITIRQSGFGTAGESIEELYYNSAGDLRARWFEPGHYIQYERNIRTRTVTEHLFRGGERFQQVLRFDPLGQVVYHESGEHTLIHEIGYDGAGRQTFFKIRTAGNGQGRELGSTAIEYNNHLQPDVVAVTREGGTRRIQYRYDPNLRRVGIEDTDLATSGAYLLTFNASGRKTLLQRPSDERAKTTYSYHESGRLHELKHVLGEGWNDEYTISIENADYDMFGNPKKIDHRFFLAGVETLNDHLLDSEEHQFDSANRLVSSTFRGSARVIFANIFGGFLEYVTLFLPVAPLLLPWLQGTARTEVKKDYSFDEFDRKLLEITRLTRDVERPDEREFLIRKFNYGAGQAVSEELMEWYALGAMVPKIVRKKFLYDVHGRRTHVVETLLDSADASRRWARLTRLTYLFESKPFLVEEFEKRGSQIVLVVRDYSIYDIFDRVIYSRHEVFDESGLGKSGSVSDLTGRFAELEDFPNLPQAGDPQTRQERFYLHENHNLLAVLDEEGRVLEEYLNDAAPNERMALRQRKRVAFRLYDYLLNLQGGALMTLQPDGEVENYFPQPGTYGESLQRVPAAVQGGFWADLTRLLQAGARNFDALIGQFTSPDPSRTRGGINLYCFPSQNPISLQDPSGRGPLLVIALAAVGAALIDLGIQVYQTDWFEDDDYDLSRGLIAAAAGGAAAGIGLITGAGASALAAGSGARAIAARGAIIAASEGPAGASIDAVATFLQGNWDSYSFGRSFLYSAGFALGGYGVGVYAGRQRLARPPAPILRPPAPTAPIGFSSVEEYEKTLRMLIALEKEGKPLVGPAGGMFGRVRAILGYMKAVDPERGIKANPMFAMGVVNGQNLVRAASSSKLGKPRRLLTGFVPAPNPKTTLLRATWKNGKPSYSRGVPTAYHTEVRTAEHLLRTLPENRSGWIWFHTLRNPCAKCFAEMVEFQRLLGENVELIVTSSGL